MITCVRMCNHVSSPVWYTLSRACIFYKWWYFCALYSTVQGTVVQCLFQAQDVWKQHRNSGDVVGGCCLMPAVVLYFARDCAPRSGIF